MIDTAGTITKAADALMADGAAGVIIAATHAILSGPASSASRTCTVERGHRHRTRCRSPDDSRFDKLDGAVDRPAHRRAIQEVFEDGSVTSLFDGHA